MNKLTIFCVLFFSLLTGCVSQTTVESKVPDQAAASDANYKARIHTERAGEYYRLGNYSVAIDAAQKALTMLPSHAPAYNMLGIIYMQIGEDAKAEQAFDQAIKLAPMDSEILNNFGWFLCQHQKPEQAMTYFQSALRNPLYGTPERAMHNAGVCAKRTGNLQVAEAQFRAALLKQPQYAPSLMEMTEILYGQGRMKEAESMLARYMQVVPMPGGDALLLAVRVARGSGDKSALDNYILQLRRRFPDSPQLRIAVEGR